MGTVCTCRFTTDREVNDAVAQLYLLDHEPGARRQQHLRIHRPTLGWPGDRPSRRGLPEYSGVVQLERANLDIPLAAAKWSGTGLLSLRQTALNSHQSHRSGPYRLVKSMSRLYRRGDAPI